MIRYYKPESINQFLLLDEDKYEEITSPKIYVVENEIKINFDIYIRYSSNISWDIRDALEAAGLSDRIIGFPCLRKPEQAVILKRYNIPTPNVFSVLSDSKANHNIFIKWIDKFKKKNKNKLNDLFLFKPNIGSLGEKQFVFKDSGIFNMNSVYIHKVINDPKSIKLVGHEKNYDTHISSINDIITLDGEEKIKKYDKLAEELHIDDCRYWHIAEHIDNYKNENIKRYEYRVIIFYSDNDEYDKNNLIITRRFERSKERPWQTISTDDEGFATESHENTYKIIYKNMMSILRDFKSPFLSTDLYIIQEDGKDSIIDFGIFEVQMEFGMRYHKIDNGLTNKINKSMDLIVKSLNIQTDIK